MSEPILVDVNADSLSMGGRDYEVIRVAHRSPSRVEVRLIRAGIRLVLSKGEAMALARALDGGSDE